MKTWLLMLLSLGLSLSVQAQQDVVRDSAELRDWFRMSELDSAAGVRRKLLAGQDPNVQGERGQRALHWALMHESGKALEVLLSDARTDVNALNAAGEKPLWLAALRGRLPWVQALLARGAQLERGPQPAAARAWTTLHYAATAPTPEVLAWLLKQGDLDLNAGSTNGSTPLMLALGYGSLDSAALLIKAGADVTRRNDLGLSAWDFAKRSGREEALQRVGIELPKPPASPAVSEKP